MKRGVLRRMSVALAIALPALAEAQTAAPSFEEFRNQARAGFGQAVQKSQDEFKQFRQKVNAEYASFLKSAWLRHEREAPIKEPEQAKPIPPVVYQEEERKREEKIEEKEEKRETPPSPKPIEIKRIVRMPTPKPAPQPIAPLDKEVPKKPSSPIAVTPIAKQEDVQAFWFFGTRKTVRWNKNTTVFRLPGVNENEVAEAWSYLSDGRTDGLLSDCLGLRDSMALNDWAYLLLLSKVSSSLLGENSNEAVLLMAWLYCQSGYKMRLASSGQRLYMLFASEHLIYNLGHFSVNGTLYYPYNCTEKSLNISTAEFPKEQALSLIMTTEPRLKSETTDARTLTSKRYSTATVSSKVNKNLIDFYSTYPTSYINGDIMTRWAMYANVPASEELQKYVYPPLMHVIEDKSKTEGAEMLLNWVQTAFTYEYDDKVWGEDRAFFADETLYYPYCDCEDRSILFSRLVRDLLGLDVMLVYYPGHLATAVAFEDNEAKGDYLNYNGRRYTICDPTYINAGIGRSMPGMDNGAVQVILLKK